MTKLKGITNVVFHIYINLTTILSYYCTFGCGNTRHMKKHDNGVRSLRPINEQMMYTHIDCITHISTTYILD